MNERLPNGPTGPTPLDLDSENGAKNARKKLPYVRSHMRHRRGPPVAVSPNGK